MSSKPFVLKPASRRNLNIFARAQSTRSLGALSEWTSGKKVNPGVE